MHDKPGIVVVDLRIRADWTLDQIKQALDDAYDAYGKPDWHTESLAVFSGGYKS